MAIRSSQRLSISCALGAETLGDLGGTVLGVVAKPQEHQHVDVNDAGGLYAAGIVSAWQIHAWIGMVFFVITVLMWLVPDRCMERALAAHTK